MTRRAQTTIFPPSDDEGAAGPPSPPLPVVGSDALQDDTVWDALPAVEEDTIVTSLSSRRRVVFFKSVCSYDHRRTTLHC